MMQSRQYVIALIVAALSTAHVLYGFIDSSRPAWGLFRRFDRYDYSLIDAQGKSFQIRDFVQQRAYVTCDHRLVKLIGGWLVESGRARPPLWGRITQWESFGPQSAEEFTIQLVDGNALIVPVNWNSRP